VLNDHNPQIRHFCLPGLCFQTLSTRHGERSRSWWCALQIAAGEAGSRRTWPVPDLTSWYTMEADVTVLPVPGGPAAVAAPCMNVLRSASSYSLTSG